MYMNILLDVDGVLVRDDTILQRVRNNISRYVRMKVPRAKNPDRLRDHLYLRYGHTGRGLTQALGIPTPDFNPYIYDRETLDTLTVSDDSEISKRRLRGSLSREPRAQRQSLFECATHVDCTSRKCHRSAGSGPVGCRVQTSTGGVHKHSNESSSDHHG